MSLKNSDLLSRRRLLARIVLGASVAYAAPAVAGFDVARASTGVNGASGGQSSGRTSGGASAGASRGSSRGRNSMPSRATNSAPSRGTNSRPSR